MPLHIPGPVSTVTALKQRLLGIMCHFAVPLLSQTYRYWMENEGQRATVLTFDAKRLTINKYKHKSFHYCQESVYLEWRTMGKEVKDWQFFWGGMENTLTGLCHYASNCFICFHREHIYSTGCKQIQVKGQWIYYPTRKGNAYIIQSTSVSHLDWTFCALVTLYAG